ncbi:unnamed protein product, partial [Ixodes hexagonus]
MKPRFEQPLVSEVRQRLGMPVTLECIARGRPQPEVKWYHEGILIRPEDSEPLEAKEPEQPSPPEPTEPTSTDDTVFLLPSRRDKHRVKTPDEASVTEDDFVMVESIQPQQFREDVTRLEATQFVTRQEEKHVQKEYTVQEVTKQEVTEITVKKKEKPFSVIEKQKRPKEVMPEEEQPPEFIGKVLKPVPRYPRPAQQGKTEDEITLQIPMREEPEEAEEDTQHIPAQEEVPEFPKKPKRKTKPTEEEPALEEVTDQVVDLESRGRPKEPLEEKPKEVTVEDVTIRKRKEKPREITTEAAEVPDIVDVKIPKTAEITTEARERPKEVTELEYETEEHREERETVELKHVPKPKKPKRKTKPTEEEPALQELTDQVVDLESRGRPKEPLEEKPKEVTIEDVTIRKPKEKPREITTEAAEVPDIVDVKTRETAEITTEARERPKEVTELEYETEELREESETVELKLEPKAKKPKKRTKPIGEESPLEEVAEQVVDLESRAR